jgi:hypothetical protein
LQHKHKKKHKHKSKSKSKKEKKSKKKKKKHKKKTKADDYGASKVKEFGYYGVLMARDRYAKQREFYLWMREEKDIEVSLIKRRSTPRVACWGRMRAVCVHPAKDRV